MDDIKQFAKNWKELAVRIYIDDIWMKFGIGKYTVLIIKGGKRQMTEGIELPNQGKIRTLGEKGTYKYLGILEADTIKQAKMKEKLKKEYLRRRRKLLENKLHSRNLIKEINTWAVPFERYSGVDGRTNSQRTRKLMTIHKALHPKEDVDRLYVPIKEKKERTYQHSRWRRYIDTTTT